MIRNSCFYQTLRGLSKIQKTKLLQDENALKSKNYLDIS